MEVKRYKKPGRPFSKDPKIHLPRVKVRRSIILQLKRIAEESGKCLSYHCGEALRKYIKEYE